MVRVGCEAAVSSVSRGVVPEDGVLPDVLPGLLEPDEPEPDDPPSIAQAARQQQTMRPIIACLIMGRILFPVF